MMPWDEFIETARRLAWAPDEATAAECAERLEAEQYWNRWGVVADTRHAIVGRATDMYIARMLGEVGQ